MSGATESGSGARPPEGATVNVAVSAELLAATARDRFPTLAAVESAIATAWAVDVSAVRNGGSTWTTNTQPVVFELTADGQAVADWLQAVGATEGFEGLDDG